MRRGEHMRLHTHGDIGNRDCCRHYVTSSTHCAVQGAPRKSSAHGGMCTDWESVDKQTPGLPMVVMIGPTSSTTTDAHLTSRLLLNKTCHDSMAGTEATCIAACSRIAGTLVHKVIDEKAL